MLVGFFSSFFHLAFHFITIISNHFISNCITYTLQFYRCQFYQKDKFFSDICSILNVQYIKESIEGRSRSRNMERE